MKQGYALAGLISEELDLTSTSDLRKIWKSNLACLVLLKASKIGIKVKAEGALWQVYGVEKMIHSLIENETFRTVCRKLMKYKLFFAQQLVNQKGKKMIT